MEADGTVRMIVLERTYSLKPKNVGQVSTTVTESRTFSFNLPDHIVNDHDFKFNDVMAFLGEGNVEFVYNVKTQLRNGEVIPIHYIPYFFFLSRLLCWLNFEGFFFIFVHFNYPLTLPFVLKRRTTYEKAVIGIELLERFIKESLQFLNDELRKYAQLTAARKMSLRRTL